MSRAKKKKKGTFFTIIFMSKYPLYCDRIKIKENMEILYFKVGRKASMKFRRATEKWSRQNWMSSRDDGKSCDRFSKLNSHRINAATSIVTRPGIKWKFRARWFSVIYRIAGRVQVVAFCVHLSVTAGSNLHRVSIESTRLRENRPHFPIPEFGLTVSFDAVSQPLPNEITPQDSLRVYGYAGPLFLFCHSNFSSRTTRSDTLETISPFTLRKSLSEKTAQQREKEKERERNLCSCHIGN